MNWSASSVPTWKPSASAGSSKLGALAGLATASTQGGGRMTARDRERFFFFMAMMLRTGQTTAESLKAIARAFKSEKNDALAASLNALAQKVAQGKPLSQAMLAERGMFTDVHRAAILAGEAANNMQKSFSVLRVLEDKAIASSRAGMAEFLTPLLMLVLSFVSLMNTGLNTLPVMANIAEQQGKVLGFLPKVIMGLTGAIWAIWLVIGGLIAMVGVGFWSLRSNPGGRTLLHQAQLEIPIYGQFLIYRTYAQMLLYFPYLIASGVKPKQLIPIMEALATNSVLRRRIDQFNHVITTGGSLSEAMTRAGFPELIVTPVAVAENYAPTEGNVNDVLIDGMTHAHGILERMLDDTQKRFVGVFSALLWVAGGALMLLDMLSIVLTQA
jgi:type II secretory pathway component PulF